MKLILITFVLALSFSCGNIDNANPIGSVGTETLAKSGHTVIEANSQGPGIVNYTFSLVIIEDTSPIIDFHVSNDSFTNLNQLIISQSIVKFGRFNQTELNGMIDLKAYLNESSIHSESSLLSNHSNKNYLYLGSNTSMHGLTRDTKLVLTLENGTKKTLFLN